jgi:orotate phosphoribosyltransferase
MLQEWRVREIFQEAGAVIEEGHFVYASGRHGSAYVNKDAIYPRIRLLDELCMGLAERFSDEAMEPGNEVEVVAAPAIGAVDLKTGVARILDRWVRGKREVRAVYSEDGQFRRGYDWLVAGKRALVVEDVLTTGGSVRATVEAVRQAGGTVVGVGALVNRGNVTADSLGVPKLEALFNVSFETYDSQECPLCAANVPINTDVGHGK